MRYRPLDFGYFTALSLLLPWVRKRKIEWFHDECEDIFKWESGHQRVSVVAHSFGSYLLAGALSKYSDLKFDRVILCGSIIRQDYPWSSIINDRKQVNAVLNEAGGRDLWPSIVSWVVNDAGPSGVLGFKDLASGKVSQRIHDQHAHSDYFYAGNYRKVWIPFLLGAEVSKVVPVAPPRTNLRFVSVVVGLVALVVIVSSFIFSRITKDDRESVVVRDPISATDSLACEGFDKDSDGVNDCLDQCPTEGFGQKVDEVGCLVPVTIDLSSASGVPFDDNKSTLRPDAIEVINEAIDMLNRYPDIRIEVAGHAYTRGTDEFNQNLSERRAKIVYDYFVTNGISKSRLVGPVGYGSSRPLAHMINEDGSPNPDGQKTNERVELNVQN